MSDLRKSLAASSRPSVFLPPPAAAAAAGRPSVFMSNNAGTRPSVFLGNAASSSSSAAPTTGSTASSTGFGNSAASEKRWASKQAELQCLLTLENQAAKLVAEIKTLDQRVGEIVGGAETLASVMSSWQGVFRAIQISRADLAMLSTETAGIIMNAAAASEAGAKAAASEKEGTTNGEEEEQAEEDPLATLDEDQVRVNTLVRIPVDDEGVVAASIEEEDAKSTI